MSINRAEISASMRSQGQCTGSAVSGRRGLAYLAQDVESLPFPGPPAPCFTADGFREHLRRPLEDHTLMLRVRVLAEVVELPADGLRAPCKLQQPACEEPQARAELRVERGRDLLLRRLDGVIALVVAAHRFPGSAAAGARFPPLQSASRSFFSCRFDAPSSTLQLFVRYRGFHGRGHEAGRTAGPRRRS
jgi:hypothetical protein